MRAVAQITGKTLMLKHLIIGVCGCLLIGLFVCEVLASLGCTRKLIKLKLIEAHSAQGKAGRY